VLIDDFIKALTRQGWKQTGRRYALEKGSWCIVCDTSRWLEIGTRATPRLRDVEVPQRPEDFQSTIDQIEQLCREDDERAS